MPLTEVDAETLRIDIEVFRDSSLAGNYYAPFDINSKNFMHIPEETEEWFEQLGDYLEQSTQLSQQGKHADAIYCFTLLYELIEAMDDGEEIVFAEEIGGWMIPVDEKTCLAAYINSLAQTSTPEEFTAAVIPLLRRDSYESFANKVYPTIQNVATPDQRSFLDAEIARQNIRTTPKR
jgi:hypothetical protein